MTDSRKKIKSKRNYKEIDLSSPNEIEIDFGEKTNSSRKGLCKGCGRDGASLRAVTNEHLCPSCRENLRFKLITKTTALNKYPNVTFQDLINNYKNRKIHCFFVKNWIDPSKDCIKLYYEKEIMALSKSKH